MVRGLHQSFLRTCRCWGSPVGHKERRGKGLTRRKELLFGTKEGETGCTELGFLFRYFYKQADGLFRCH